MLLFIILLVFILIAVGVTWYLLAHDHGEKEPIGALWLAAGFGLLGGIGAAALETFLLPAQDLKPGAPVLALLLASLAVGVIEEACKFLPLSLFLYPKRYFNEHTDGVIYFALAGLGFGLPENILYSLQFGTSVGVGRMILTPFFHAATTGMVGYFLAKSKLSGRSRRHVWLALMAAMVLHGLYDFGLSSGISILTLLSILITLSASIGLFLFFMRATDLDQEQGLSIVGTNNFCRSCGKSNPQHHLYCIHCGNHA